MKNKSKRGSLTLEAAFALPLFMFAIFGMLTFLGYIKIYDRVETSINDTATLFAKNSYILADLGIDDFMSDLQGYDASMTGQNFVRNVAKVTNITNLITPGTTEQIDTINYGLDYNFSKENLKSRIVGGSKQEFGVYLGLSLLNIFISNGTGESLPGVVNNSMEGLLSNFVKNTAAANLEVEFEDDLEHSGILKNSDGEYFNLEDTKYQLGSTDEIEIVVKYRIKLPGIMGDNLSLPIKQRVAIKPWGGK